MDNKNKKRKGLKNKEIIFCYYFANTQSVELSAIKAGYRKNPLVTGQGLLYREDIKAKIKELMNSQKELYSSLATAGYQRLAFSSVSDAVSLLFMDSPDKKTLENMDLYMVSEIRKPRDGAMEIKFFDRIKALEKLCQLSSGDESKNMGLLSALNMGAENLSRGDDEYGV
ncbi:MAG: terminase small subunit [Ruminococcus sp.]|nr:terminase small subunit [Ruminococcus sp.]